MLSESYLSRHYSPVELGFSVDTQAYTTTRLIAAQTCGYPFVTRWADTHDLVAVALFDVPGCPSGNAQDGPGQYSSWFITRADNAANSLPEFRNKRVALNSEDSNSGMNVLRHAISQTAKTDTFFSERLLTGGHRQSMHAVTEGHADLAAVDVVTYALLNDIEPELIRQLKIIDQSVVTTGLPFIRAKHSEPKLNDLCSAMNSAVEHMNPRARKVLRLSGFTPVAREDYLKIEQLEGEAISAGYPELK